MDPALLFDKVKDILDWLLGPTTFFLFSVAGLAALIIFRESWTRPKVAFSIAVFSVAFFLVSVTDHDLALTVKKPDNVPILIMVGLLALSLWIAFRKMVLNDKLTSLGLPTIEGRESKKRVLCWPDLLYQEFICLIIISILLTWWAIELKAPLEEPASQAKTPNPSKAPWYFLGLQEMLVYFDPWLAGVVFPSYIIVGLMAVPYIDPNPKGNGYYTFKQRPFAICTYLFGFVVLWVLLIMMGTFLRGPNWNFFGFYEYWDVHKVEALTNVNLSEYFYNHFLGRALPESIILRELPGFIVVAAYFIVLPPILANTVFRKMYQEMGFIRFNAMAHMLIFMAALPIKMALRWTINLKYIVAIPEKFFNI